MVGRVRWTDELTVFVTEIYPNMTNAEVLGEIREKFGVELTMNALSSWASDNGLRKADNKPPWTPETDEWLVAYVPGHTENEVIDAFEERFGVRLTRPQLKNRKTKLRLSSGTHGGRFEKGHKSKHKGLTWDEIGWTEESKARSRRTQFGSTDADPNAFHRKPIGYERVRTDGYVEVKVRDDQETANGNFRMKHHVVWEEANGRPVPDGYAIVFADTDKTNFDPENLVPVRNGVMSTIARLGLTYRDKDTLEACVALAGLRSAMWRARKKNWKRAKR